jgi:hypothetical protein
LALLIFLLTFLLPVQAFAAVENLKAVEVIYDPGNPEASVGIYGEDLLETGEIYEDYTVISFESNAIIVRDGLITEQEKWLKNGSIPEELERKARWLFIAKQMRAIHEAQIKYLEKFSDHYAPSLADLINQGLLTDGFIDDTKEGYRFEIKETGETKRMAPHYIRLPTFLAAAVPLDPEKDKLYFSVDQLGQIRYAHSKRQLTWGPVWDYNQVVNAKLPSRVITYDDEN